MLGSETDWRETMTAGWDRFWPRPLWSEPPRETTDYGAGEAADRIVAGIRQSLGAQQQG